MTLLAGLAVGVFVYFLVGFLTGYAPEIKVRRFRRRAQISNRQLWLNQAGVELCNTHCSDTLLGVLQPKDSEALVAALARIVSAIS